MSLCGVLLPTQPVPGKVSTGRPSREELLLCVSGAYSSLCGAKLCPHPLSSLHVGCGVELNQQAAAAAPPRPTSAWSLTLIPTIWHCVLSPPALEVRLSAATSRGTRPPARSPGVCRHSIANTFMLLPRHESVGLSLCPTIGKHVYSAEACAAPVVAAPACSWVPRSWLQLHTAGRVVRAVPRSASTALVTPRGQAVGYGSVRG